MAISASSADVVRLSYESIRNLTSPDEKKNGTRTFFANLPASEILKLNTDGNLRDYIPAHPGKKRNSTHKAIADTILNRPDRFITMNSGFTISALDVEVDDNKKIAILKGGTIINGAQSQGELRRFFEEYAEGDTKPEEFYVRAEIIVLGDPDFITDTAIARNTSTNVAALSMAGKKQYFDDLETSFQRVYPALKLRKSETDTEGEYIDTQKLLQLCTVLMPPELLDGAQTANSKLKAYRNRAQCLIDFEVICKQKIDGDSRATERYQYYVDIAPFAWKEYLHWRHHEGWEGKRLFESTKAIKRDGNDSVTVTDGIVFPILSAMSLFVGKNADGRWVITKPSIFDDSEMLEAAVDQFRSNQSNPMYMGRNAGVYESLMLIPKMVHRLVTRVGS